MTETINASSVVKPSIEKVYWPQIREQAVACGLSSHLIDIIDNLKPDKNLALYKAKIPYGSKMFAQGKVLLPTQDGRMLPIDHPDMDPELAKDLSYNHKTNPTSIILKNTAEIFLEVNRRIIPLYGLIKPGSLISSWMILNPEKTEAPPFLWDMTAGARSIFLLPSISQRAPYEKLRKEFDLESDQGDSLLDHWYTFREIANTPKFIDQHGAWHTEILYFSKAWFANFHQTKLPIEWTYFREYLLYYAWNNSEFWRNQFIWDSIFSIIQDELHNKPNPYIVETVKQLFSIAVGSVPGFTPANTNLAAPIKGLMNVYKNIYGLDEYPPIIMQPQLYELNSTKPNPVYYSLMFPTSIEFSPRTRNRSNTASDLRQTKDLLDKCVEIIESNRFNLANISLYKAIKKVDFDFFYMGDGFPDYNIQPSQSIAINSDFSKFKSYSCCNAVIPSAKSAFTSSCIRIQKKR